MKKMYAIIALCCLSLYLLPGATLAQNEGRGKAEKHGQGKGHEKQDKDKRHGKDHLGKPGHDQEDLKEKSHQKERKEHPEGHPGKAHGRGHQKDHKNDKDHGDKAENKAGRDQEDRGGNRESRSAKQKVTICHKPQGKEGGFPITISERAWKAHAAHGDSRGACPKPLASTPVIKKQADFYEQVASTEEKVYDKEDLLAIARERLRKAKESLEKASKTKTLPPAEIKAREARITRTGTLIEELEKMVAETRQQIRSDVERVEATLQQ